MNNENFCLMTIESLKKIIKPSYEINNDFIMVDSFEDVMEGVFMQPCRINAYVGAILTSGKARVRVNLEEFEVTHGMLLMIAPDKFVQLISVENVVAKAFMISESFFQEIHLDLRNVMPLYVEMLNRSYLNLTEHEERLFQQYFDLIEETASTPENRFYKETLFKLGSAFAFNIGSVFYKQEKELVSEITSKTRGEKTFMTFMDLISKYHKSERRVDFYAGKLSVTPKYLTTLIKKVSGKSAAQWIDEFIILEAKNLLKYSDMNIQEIAYDLNFPSQSFFGKYFKHHTSMTPGAYRLSCNSDK